jgi:hypothetical protein
VTSITGPQYCTALDRIEIDITFSCNLRCLNCDRSCSQAPDERRMDVAQIARFIEESLATAKEWSKISLMGGEPFLHPQVHEIMELLLAFRTRHSPGTMLEIATNGHGVAVRKAISMAPEGFFIRDSAKTSPIQEDFEPFSIAPCDRLRYRSADFRNACWITAEVGIGLNRFGFYQCAVAGGIDRVLGFDIGLKRLPEGQGDLLDLKRGLCRYCGHFNNPRQRQNRSGLRTEPRSKSWREAYRLFQREPVPLTPY